jgi:radical SAM superfamily enzyme YgiQ (UPF0313 family)
MFPGRMLAYLGADMGIQGEGERSFAMLLDRIENGGDLSAIPGLHHRAGRIGNPPDVTGDLDRFLFPDPHRHLLSLTPPCEGAIWLPFQTRRGCPLDCSYCSTGMIEGKHTRKRSVGPVVAALSEYVSAGFDHFFFVDNTFNLPRGYAADLCDRIMEAGLDITWRCILYPGQVTAGLVEKMARSGCVEVSLGMESGSEALLKRMNKRYGTKDVGHASDLLQKNGIRRMGFLLLGGPGETRDTVLESLRFAGSLDLDMGKITIGVRIYPETRIARHARRVGKLSYDDDLLHPRFYLEDGMESWTRAVVGEWMKDHPHWIY